MRPSELVGIEAPYVAYCLDEAVHELAAWVEDELDKVEVQGKDPDQKKLKIRRKARLEFLLTGNYAKQFADPMKR